MSSASRIGASLAANVLRAAEPFSATALDKAKSQVGARFTRDSVRFFGPPMTGQVPHGSDLETAFQRRRVIDGTGWTAARQNVFEGEKVTAFFALDRGVYSVQLFDWSGVRVARGERRERDPALSWDR